MNKLLKADSESDFFIFNFTADDNDFEELDDLIFST